MNSTERVRYARHLLLPGVGEEGQRRLLASRVLVVGLGGLGCPSALYLAAAGVGTLGLVEFDRVEASNLQRQILYGDADVGASKLERAADRLLAQNPSLRLERHPVRLDASNAIAILSGYDLVLDGTDNFATRYLLNDAAFLAGIPLVSASLFQFEGQLTVYDARRGGPCLRCLYPTMPGADEVPNCSEAGIFGALCGVMGSLQALEAIKILAGCGEPLRGRMLCIDALGQRHPAVRVERDPACALCGDAPSITDLQAQRDPPTCIMTHPSSEISPRDAAARKDLIYVDVREPHEWEICHLPGARLIPLKTLGARRTEIPRDQTVVLYCHHGMRSQRAQNLLRDAGWTNLLNLTGGIEQWAVDLDPTMARY